MNSNLFKEAIADAKAVRQTALANAKVALEEAFSERYQKMFAEKLREETEEECATPDMDTPDLADECGSGCNTEELDELIAELESEVEDSSGTDAGATAPPANAGDMGAPEAGTPSVGAAPAVCPPGTIPCPGAPGGQPIPQGPSPAVYLAWLRRRWRRPKPAKARPIKAMDVGSGIDAPCKSLVPNICITFPSVVNVWKPGINWKDELKKKSAFPLTTPSRLADSMVVNVLVSKLPAAAPSTTSRKPPPFPRTLVGVGVGSECNVPTLPEIRS